MTCKETIKDRFKLNVSLHAYESHKLRHQQIDIHIKDKTKRPTTTMYGLSDVFTKFGLPFLKNHKQQRLSALNLGFMHNAKFRNAENSSD